MWFSNQRLGKQLDQPGDTEGHSIIRPAVPEHATFIVPQSPIEEEVAEFLVKIKLCYLLVIRNLPIPFSKVLQPEEKDSLCSLS